MHYSSGTDCGNGRYPFLIEKMVDENHSETVIRPLDKSQSEQELARILGGVEITESVLEMRER